MSDEYEPADAILRSLADLRATVDRMISDQKRHLLSTPEPVEAPRDPWPGRDPWAEPPDTPPARGWYRTPGAAAAPRSDIDPRDDLSADGDAPPPWPMSRLVASAPPPPSSPPTPAPASAEPEDDDPRKRLDALARRLNGRLRPVAREASEPPAPPTIE